MKKIKKLVLLGLFLAIGFVLPFFTGQIREIGNMLLPMHMPVMLCGLICGAPYGLIVGFILPITRSMIYGQPIMFPRAICMSFELATYGFLTGFLYNRSKYKCIKALYKALIPSMIIGRVVWGIASYFVYGLLGKVFTYKLFFAGAFLNAIPGIILELILIPAIMIALDKTYLRSMKGDL